jgi:hypothetical protein
MDVDPDGFVENVADKLGILTDPQHDTALSVLTLHVASVKFRRTGHRDPQAITGAG